LRDTLPLARGLKNKGNTTEGVGKTVFKEIPPPYTNMIKTRNNKNRYQIL
jgi:hypothetical protein